MLAANDGVDRKNVIPHITHEVTSHLRKLTARYGIQWFSINHSKEMSKLAFGPLPGALLRTSGRIRWQSFDRPIYGSSDVATLIKGHLLASTTLQSNTLPQDLVVTSNFCTMPG